MRWNWNSWKTQWNGSNLMVHDWRVLQLYTAKSQYWLHEAGASPEHWQIKINN